ncbi:hypothetical protein [Tessaracoccus sp. OH4464_COT-324]|uniref:hypothetical protein n=1 Tax=Tessaracoccus sp. OH4464_COT-324 TaxID=2491059 RepID=UPI000F642894|nr:hypothetical protein [Tessaracoccus sp. OH4464_COT-324]RRD47777.1 hypothetical protein EII42_00540 [Tessaracoccus sp. OH4464_COT-324]
MGFVEEMRWTFTPPFGWLQGVAFNLTLAAAYLVVWPLAFDERYDVVLLFTVYFATFIMADVTTTNIFGHDFSRTQRRLDAGEGFMGILFQKNLIQLMVVILPMFVITGLVTWWWAGVDELVLALPGILYPMLLWLGVGNLVSVAFPVLPAPVKWRLHNWRAGMWRMHLPVLLAYGIPYGLYFGAAYTDLPGNLNALIRFLGDEPEKWQSGMILLVASVLFYAFFTSSALVVFARCGLLLHGQAQFLASAPMPESERALLAARIAPGDADVD